MLTKIILMINYSMGYIFNILRNTIKLNSS